MFFYCTALELFIKPVRLWYSEAAILTFLQNPEVPSFLIEIQIQRHLCFLVFNFTCGEDQLPRFGQPCAHCVLVVLQKRDGIEVKQCLERWWCIYQSWHRPLFRASSAAKKKLNKRSRDNKRYRTFLFEQYNIEHVTSTRSWFAQDIERKAGFKHLIDLNSIQLPHITAFCNSLHWTEYQASFTVLAFWASNAADGHS